MQAAVDCNGSSGTTTTITDDNDDILLLERTNTTVILAPAALSNEPRLTLRHRFPANLTATNHDYGATTNGGRVHFIDAANYLDCKVKQIYGMAKLSPQVTPSQNVNETAPMTTQTPTAATAAAAAAATNLNRTEDDAIDASESSCSTSVSNSTSFSSTSSVIATPIRNRGANGEAASMEAAAAASDNCDNNEMLESALEPLNSNVLTEIAPQCSDVNESIKTEQSSFSSLCASAAPSSAASSETTLAKPPALQTPKSLRHSFDAQLLQWQDMPQYLQFNPYVLSGYRPLTTFKGCLLSLFYWHNETINILTHAIPIIYILATVPGLMPWERGHRFLSFCHVFGSVAPWCGSFVYHLFMNIEKGENVYYRLLKLDMVGIWVSQSFGAMPLVTATTFCFSYKWKWLIITSYCLLSFWGLYKALTASSPWQRRLCFALPFTMRWILTFLRIMGLINRGNRVMSHVYLQDGVSILGGAIGAMHIPEKWFPGLVDYYLNSHNIMHVLVVVAVYSMHQATMKDIEWMSTATCVNLSNSTSATIESSLAPSIEL